MSPRNQKLSAAICLTPLLLVATDAARADLAVNPDPRTINDAYGPGAGFAIPDNTPAGGSSTINAVNVANPTISSFDSVTINVSVAHTWIGDLTATISHNGVDVQLFRRPGASGAGAQGDWLVGAYTFVTSGGLSMPTTNSTTNVTPGTYNRTNNAASTATPPAPDPDTFAAFTGMDLNGIWTLNISDNALQDTGSIGSWSMNITSVPEPSTFALLGMMAAGALGVRTWRKRKAA